MADRVYTLDELDVLEQMNNENVTQEHLDIVTEYVVSVLNDSDIPYAIMGGMHMIMRGFEDRTTTDVDIAVQSDTRTILRALESDPRILRPRAQSVAGSGVARIFVATGPAYGHNVQPLAVEVDLILSGNRGAPRQLNEQTVVQIDWRGPSGMRRYNILSLQEIFKAKLAAYHERLGSNDYADLIWMCQHLPDRIRVFSGSLDEDLRGYFMEAFSEIETASDEEINGLQQTLNL